MTLETTTFLISVVNSLTLSAGADNFAEVADSIKTAKEELNAEIIRCTEALTEVPVVD